MIDLSKDEPRVRFASMLIITITWCFYSIPLITADKCTYRGNYCNSTFNEHHFQNCSQSNVEQPIYECEGYMNFRGNPPSCGNIFRCVKDGYIIDNDSSYFDQFDVSRDLIVYTYPLVLIIICIVQKTIIVYIFDVIFDILLFLMTLGNTPYWLIIPCCILTVICAIIQVFSSNKKGILTATIIQSSLDVIIGLYLFIGSIYIASIVPSYEIESNLLFIPLGFACIEHIVIYFVKEKEDKDENEDEYIF